MLKEKYNKYKEIYNDYLILIKNGNFYLALNNDAILMNRLFGYQIKEFTNFIKAGFPINSLNKIVIKLDNLNVNYLIIDNEIIEKRKFKENLYKKYCIKPDNYEILISRINKISEVLRKNLNNKDIKIIIEQIEDCLCKISY